MLQYANMLDKSHRQQNKLSDCLGVMVPGSDLHQLLPAALCQLRRLGQRLFLQRRAKQPEENVLLLGTETAAACRGEWGGQRDNVAGQTDGRDLQLACLPLSKPLELRAHLSAPRCSTAQW